MFLKLTLLLALQTQNSGAQSSEAGNLISKSLSRYYAADVVTGTIRLTQTAQNASVQIETQLQFERAKNRIYLQQSRNGSNARKTLLKSDGVYFSYDRPPGVIGKDRLREFVTQHGVTQTIQDMYSAFARTNLDRSPVLDIAISRREDLARLLEHWGTVRVKERTTFRGEKAVVIEGPYFDIPGEGATGTFQIVLNEESQDILQYRQTQRFRIPDQVKTDIEVVSVWDVNLKVNGPINAALFSGA